MKGLVLRPHPRLLAPAAEGAVAAPPGGPTNSVSNCGNCTGGAKKFYLFFVLTKGSDGNNCHYDTISVQLMNLLLAIDKVPSVDYKRTLLFTFLGLVLVEPTFHFWYLYLSKLITRPGASGAILRLLLDQSFFSPTFIGVFLSALVTLEGRPSQVVPKLKQDMLEVVTIDIYGGYVI